MATVSLTGNDTIQIGDLILADLGDGDVVDITYPNELVGVTVGKNGNAIHALNETGKIADVIIRVIRGSSDDKALNSLRAGMLQDFAAFNLLTAQFTKRAGDGDGNITSDIYDLSGGSFVKNIDTKSNVAGETDQGISIYTLKFTNAARSLA
jgi:hypothetical protein